MTLLVRPITPPKCYQQGCTAPATVVLQRRWQPGASLGRFVAGYWCHPHSIERVEYEVECEREQREQIAADLAAGRAITYGPTGMYGCARAVCTMCGAMYTRTDTPEGNRRFAHVLDSHNDRAHPDRIVRYRYES